MSQPPTAERTEKQKSILHREIRISGRAVTLIATVGSAGFAMFRWCYEEYQQHGSHGADCWWFEGATGFCLLLVAVFVWACLAPVRKRTGAEPSPSAGSVSAAPPAKKASILETEIHPATILIALIGLLTVVSVVTVILAPPS